MNICHKGREMLMDLNRSNWLPPYDEDGIRIILQELEGIYQKLTEMLSVEEEDITDSLKVTLTFYHQAAIRNRRYLFAYLLHRMNKLRELRWETGVVVPEHMSQPGLLSAREHDYFSEYNQALNEYFDGIDFDLTADIKPPKELFIEIRVLENCGEILTENGVVNMVQGSRACLRRTDVEHLIRQGKVEHVTST